MLADALEHLIKGIVAHPDDVTVKEKDLRRGRMLEVRVNPDDVGKVIGRSGRTATALRTVIGALAGDQDVRVDFVDVDRLARPRARPPKRSSGAAIEHRIGPPAEEERADALLVGERRRSRRIPARSAASGASN